MTTEANDLLPCWAIVELMGHAVVAGYCTEQPIAGGATLRIDQPAVEGRPQRTELVNPNSVYRLTPCDEATARAYLQRHLPRAAWEHGLAPTKAVPRLPAPESMPDGFDFEEDAQDLIFDDEG